MWYDGFLNSIGLPVDDFDFLFNYIRETNKSQR